MKVLHLSLWSLNIRLHGSFRQVPIRTLQHVLLLTLHDEEASGYNILMKCNFCNFTLPWMSGAVTPFAPSAHPWVHCSRPPRS